MTKSQLKKLVLKFCQHYEANPEEGPNKKKLLRLNFEDDFRGNHSTFAKEKSLEVR